MAHTIVGKLNKAANEIPTQNGAGFGIRLGVQYYDRETKKKEWVNYEAVIFASQPQQVQFYKDVLVEGSVVEVSGEALKIKQFQGQNGLSLSLEIIGAKLGYVHAGQAQQQQQAYSTTQQSSYQPQQQQAYAVPQQQQYAQQQQQYAQQLQQQAYAAPAPQQQQTHAYAQQPQQQQAYAPQQHTAQGLPLNQGFAQPQHSQQAAPASYDDFDDNIPF